MHISDVSMHMKAELAQGASTQQLGVGKATPREVLRCAEWNSPMATAVTIHNQTLKRAWCIH
jgi:hypothetical protein